jgi:hypothetical protein
MLIAVSCLVNSRNIELWSTVAAFLNPTRSDALTLRPLDCSIDTHLPENMEYPDSRADATASARYQIKLVSEGNFITKNMAVRYQLYVIGAVTRCI